MQIIGGNKKIAPPLKKKIIMVVFYLGANDANDHIWAAASLENYLDKI